MVLVEDKARTDGQQPTVINVGTNDGLVVDPDGQVVDEPTDIIPVTTGRIICISGFADSSRDMANRLPKEVEIWGLNRCYTYLKIWHRWYEVHDKELYTGQTGLREADYLARLKEAKKPIYMQHLDPSLPSALQLPVKEMIAHFKRDYFTTSIAYMVAHAIYEHDHGDTIQEIKMFGVDMSAFSEYSYQRPCVEYWLGVAEGRGIKVTIPTVSPVLKAIASYGRHMERGLWAQAEERLASLKSATGQQAANLQAATGAANEYNNVTDPLKLFVEGFTAESIDDLTNTDVRALLSRVFADATKYSAEMQTRFQDLQKAIPQMQADLNANMGASREAQHWKTVFGAPQLAEEEPEVIKLPKA